MVKHILILVLSLQTASYTQAAQLPQFLIDRDESFKVTNNLRIPGLRGLCEDFEYPEDASPKAFLYDFNGDKVYDIIIKSYGSLCGTGGCEYVLIDGRTKTKIAEFFGNPIAVLPRNKGQSFPDIQAFAYNGSGAVILETFSYSNGKYVSRSSKKLSARGAEKYFKRNEKVPVERSK